MTQTMEISQNINAQGSIPSQEQEFITKRIIAAWDTSGSSQILQTARTFLTNSADGSDTSMVAFRSLVLELFFAGLRGLMAITTIGTFFANLYKDTAKKTGSQEQENASGYVGPNGPGDALTIPSTLVDALWVLDQQTDPSLGEGVLPERAKLVALAKDLMSKHFIPEVMMRERLELEFQNAIGLINDTRGAAKKEVRMRTSMLYVQTKYNLLREEPEGFSKLITEVFRNLPPLFDCHEPSSGGPRLTKEEAAQRRAEAVEERAHIVMENIQSLIGYFDLDPNRVLDLILDSFTANIADHWDFFVRLLEMSPWRAKETTPNEPRSVCGQILGFKFDWYRGPTHTKSIPDALIFVAAVTIKHGLVALGDLYPHLSTPDEGVTTLYEELCKQYRKKERTAGRFKGLELTGSLADDGKESTAAAGGAATVIEVEPELQCDVNQKAEIAAALIAIGDFKHGFQILERLPNLVHLHPEIADNICRYLRLLIDEWDLKPLARATRLPKPSPEDYRPGANTINVKLAPVFERVNMGRKDNAPRYKFFYSDWKADKPTVRTVGELVQRIRMYLVHVGCHLHRDPLLVAQLIRIGALHVSECKKRLQNASDLGSVPHPGSGDPFENVKYESTVNGWLNVVVNYLLPAISCSDPNPANSQGLWTIIKQFPYEKRFALYGEWKNRLYGDNAEMQLARAGCERDCRYILSRLNKESAKQSGRQIGKVLHSNPVIAFSYIITRLEAYDNMIPYVVDATRYLTELEFDILPYCLIDALAVAKSKVQRNGLNISDWLKSLGSFTGQAFKKHPMDLEPLLRYLTNQLCSGNLHDLHILQEVIGTMSGVKIMDDVTEAQLEAIAGSETLKRESFFWEPMRTTRKSGNRLMKALIDTGFAKKLAILISQRKQEVPYIGMGSEDDNLDLKILSWLNDYCQRTLAQFLDFLAVTAPSESYSAAMPEVGELINLYGLDPEQAFSIARPKLATYVKHQNHLARLENAVAMDVTGLVNGDISKTADYMDVTEPINCNALKNNELQTDEMQVAPPKDTPNAATKSVSIDGKSGPSVMEFKSNPVWQTGLYSTIDSVIPILPPSAWRGISPMFYVTFWQLTLHDIFLPKERYSGEITHQKKIVRDLEREIAKLIQDFGVTEDVRKKRKDVDRANQVIKSLEGEWRAHEDHHAKVMERMTAESTHWFETSVGRNETIQMMIQYCLQPRCTQSPVDAVFCAKFIMMMHRLGTPFIPTVTLYDKIFSRDVLHATIFSATEDEAKNFGLFLAVIFGTLSAWNRNSELYKKEAVGTDLPGFLKRWPTGLPGAKIVLGNADFINFDEFRQVHRKWHLKLSKAITACISSTEYMQIRNAIFVLDRVNNYFPATKQVGYLIDNAVKEMLEIETREDLKQLARSVAARLGAKAKTWIDDLPKGKGSGVQGAAPPPASTAALTRAENSVKREKEIVKAEVKPEADKKDAASAPKLKEDEGRERGEIGEIRRVQLEPRSAPEEREPARETRRSRESTSSATVKVKEYGGTSGSAPTIPAAASSPTKPSQSHGGNNTSGAHHRREGPATPLPKIPTPQIVVKEKDLPPKSDRDRERRNGDNKISSNEPRSRPHSDVENASPPAGAPTSKVEPSSNGRHSHKDSTPAPSSLMAGASGEVVIREREKDSRKDEKRGSGRDRDKDRGKDKKDRDRKRKDRDDASAPDDRKDRKRDRGDREDRESKRSRRGDEIIADDSSVVPSSGNGSSRKRHAEDDLPTPGGIDSYRPGNAALGATTGGGPGTNKRIRESPRDREHRDRDDRDSRRRRSSGR